MAARPFLYRALGVIAYLASLHLLFLYGLPSGLLIALAIGLATIYWRAGVMASVTITGTLAIVTLIYAVTLHVSDFKSSIYYRPDEILSEFRDDYGHRAYQPNATIRMHMPHGDLQPMTREEIRVPRDVDHHIDGYGFRNDNDYDGEKYVLVGDSFVAGSSNTQADLLSRQLKDRYGIAVYNLAHPGGLPDYAAYVSAFRRQHTGFRVLLFVFEGNDFEEGTGKKTNTTTDLWKRYYAIFSNTATHRVTKSLIKRATRRTQIASSSYVTVREVEGRKLAFLTRYIEATRATDQPPLKSFEQALRELQPFLAQVYFIPTNYRLYFERIEHLPFSSLPDAKWKYLSALCRREGIACTNLTEPMRRAANRLWPRGELLWWPDDTHWNRQGIAVAAQAVQETLRQLEPNRPHP
jgi:hypothetical protein